MKYKIFPVTEMSKPIFWGKKIHVVVCCISYQGPLVHNLMKLLANMRLKFLSWNMANTLIFLAEKMWVAFALTILQQKYKCIWKYLTYNS